MLKKGFLASTTIAISDAYTMKIINKYIKNFELVFKKIKKSIDLKYFKLKGPIKHDTFQRITG